MNFRTSLVVSLVGVAPLAVAAPQARETRPIDWVKTAFGTPPQVFKAADSPSLVVVVKGPEASATMAIAAAAQSLASGKKEKATESVCLMAADAKGAKLVSRAVLTSSQYSQLARSIPVLGNTEVGMAINLKAAGLTTEPVFLNIQADDETRKELMGMASTGLVRLSARLAKAPTPEQTAMAKIETDKGTLGLKMILDTPDLKLGENQLIFSTPARRTVSIPLLRLPRMKEVISNLVTPGGMAKLVPMRLSVGTDGKAGFVVEFREDEAQVNELGKKLGAIPVDGSGRVVGPPVINDWAPVLKSQHALGGACKHTLTLLGVGEQGFMGTLQAYYPGDESLMERVLEFDPETQVPAEQFTPEGNCASAAAK